jgi:Glutaminase
MNRLCRSLLTLTFGLTILAFPCAARTEKATPKPGPPTTSSVFYRTKGVTEWDRFGIYANEDEGRSVFRHLAESGYEVELRISNVEVPKTPARPKKGILPLPETVTLARAREAFDWIAKAPDIAFRYPGDGCYARAHLMSQRLQKNGFRPRKVWAFSNGESLHVHTKNHPTGEVTWGYHVAPALRVRFEDDTQKWYVLDPSLFTQPVPVAEWEMAMRKNKDDHAPYLTITNLGQAPKLLDGRRTSGSGYWPSADPRQGIDAHAVNIMKKYKPYEGKIYPRSVGRGSDSVNGQSRLMPERWMVTIRRRETVRTA